MLLVIWAASYGVDECGREEPHDGAQGVRRRKKRTNDMVQELLQLIDHHGLPRKPSWDGVRVLLLVMPLTEGQGKMLLSLCVEIQLYLYIPEVAHPLERLVSSPSAFHSANLFLTCLTDHVRNRHQSGLYTLQPGISTVGEQRPRSAS